MIIQGKGNNHRLFMGMVSLAVTYGLFLRLLNFGRPITYDELWTLSDWVPKSMWALLSLVRSQLNQVPSRSR